MTASLHILTLDPTHEKPERCQVCWANQPAFIYEWRPLGLGESKTTHGFCCPECAIELVRDMRSSEIHEWAGEEGALNAEVPDFMGPHDHKVSAFAATE